MLIMPAGHSSTRRSTSGACSSASHSATAPPNDQPITAQRFLQPGGEIPRPGLPALGVRRRQRGNPCLRTPASPARTGQRIAPAPRAPCCAARRRRDGDRAADGRFRRESTSVPRSRDERNARSSISDYTMAAHSPDLRTDIPARLDRLPWSAWHWRVVIALGVSWLLDGLEVTVVGSLGPALQRPETLGLSAGQIGWAASAYIGGAVLGALYFGRLADKLGRKRMFLVTLVVYLIATVLTALTWDIYSFAFCRFLTGFGIGGEYAAINSAIDELIPARVRGRVDLAINGSFWIGAAMGAGLSVVLLDPRFVDPGLGWRLAFGLGGVLGIAILLVRRHVPESPRWLLAHGRHDEAEAIVRRIETEVGVKYEKGEHTAMRALRTVSWGQVLHVLVHRYRRRTVLGLSLMASQAFFYNAIFFTYALVLSRFHGVPEAQVGYYIFPFALGNFLGPLLLGRFFDVVG